MDHWLNNEDGADETTEARKTHQGDPEREAEAAGDKVEAEAGTSAAVEVGGEAGEAVPTEVGGEAGEAAAVEVGDEVGDEVGETATVEVGGEAGEAATVELGDEAGEATTVEVADEEAQRAGAATMAAIAERADVSGEAEEQEQLAEEERVAEEGRAEEEERVAEEGRAEEEERVAEEGRAEEEERVAEQERLAEEERVALEQAEAGDRPSEDEAQDEEERANSRKEEEERREADDADDSNMTDMADEAKDEAATETVSDADEAESTGLLKRAEETGLQRESLSEMSDEPPMQSAWPESGAAGEVRFYEPPVTGQQSGNDELRPEASPEWRQFVEAERQKAIDGQFEQAAQAVNDRATGKPSGIDWSEKLINLFRRRKPQEPTGEAVVTVGEAVAMEERTASTIDSGVGTPLAGGFAPGVGMTIQSGNRPLAHFVGNESSAERSGNGNVVSFAAQEVLFQPHAPIQHATEQVAGMGMPDMPASAALSIPHAAPEPGLPEQTGSIPIAAHSVPASPGKSDAGRTARRPARGRKRRKGAKVRKSAVRRPVRRVRRIGFGKRRRTGTRNKRRRAPG